MNGKIVLDTIYNVAAAEKEVREEKEQRRKWIQEENDNERQRQRRKAKILPFSLLFITILKASCSMQHLHHLYWQPTLPPPCPGGNPSPPNGSPNHHIKS